MSITKEKVREVISCFQQFLKEKKKNFPFSLMKGTGKI